MKGMYAPWQPGKLAAHRTLSDAKQGAVSDAAGALVAPGTTGQAQTGQDFPVFTTDPQSTWLPSTNPNLPASPAQQQLQSPESQQQDFVLFDQPQPRQHPNRSTTSLQSQRRHSSHQHYRRQQPVSPAVQNQRVAQLLHAFGHPSSTANVNRLQNQFYASSAPSSSVTLNQQSRPARPPVPLFSQSTGSVPHTAKMMNAADVELEEFTAFEGGANTAFSSPAVPTVFDFNNGSASSSTSNLGTISPQDLLIQDPFMSAPNSSALTALTSPSIYNESPDFTDGYDVSPNFGSAEFEGAGDPWFPLFPQETTTVPEQQSLDNSPAQQSDDLDSVGRSSSGGRRKSGNSPPTSTRHSSVSGVNARKRDKPLPPIIVEDPSDTIAMKRARNTLAARKSRERKAQRFDELEDRIAKLEAERDHWKKIALAHSGA
ncbi:General control protein [Neonectria magnoliae]|uniref:General control protein n=1 Tax=Neonectria magnoliae TaxID=2732573 RepID=A0ABR1HXY9_9HYPO